MKFYLLFVKKLMRNSLLVLICNIPIITFSQVDANSARFFRLHNLTDTSSVIMENSDRPLPAAGIPTYAITITVTNIRNKEGVIRFKFYDAATPFPDKRGFLRIVVPKSNVIDNTFTTTYYGFPSMIMGIALLDDENSNWELDKGWFLPTEGHAFSDYLHTSLRKPVYSDFAFMLSGDRHVIMKMKYY